MSRDQYTLFQNGRQANWPLWPRSRLNILLNLTFESEAIRANLHGNKRILKWRPFWNKVYWGGGGGKWSHEQVENSSAIDRFLREILKTIQFCALKICKYSTITVYIFNLTV